jgi:hypothetical protein
MRPAASSGFLRWRASFPSAPPAREDEVGPMVLCCARDVFRITHDFFCFLFFDFLFFLSANIKRKKITIILHVVFAGKDKEGIGSVNLGQLQYIF